MRLPDHKKFRGIMNHKPFRVFEKEPTVENAAECIVAFVDANEGFYPGANDLHGDIYKIIYEGLVSTTRENETLRERVEELEGALRQIGLLLGEPTTEWIGRCQEIAYAVLRGEGKDK